MPEQTDDTDGVDDVDETEPVKETEPTGQAVPARKAPVPAQTQPSEAADSWKPPTKAEYDRLAKELRLAVREAKERKDLLAKRDLDDATEGEKAVIKAREEAAAARDQEWRPAVVEARAEAALASAGCTDPEKQALMLRLIDQTTVELDDRRRVIGGLAEQVDMIKEKFPDAFAVARAPRVPSAREVDAGDKRPPAVKKTATQQQVERMFSPR
jgi:hypothetical protein